MISQKTREGCGCFRGLFGGSRGKLRESPGKLAGKIFPKRQMLQILGFRAPGKANLLRTLGRHGLDLVPTFRAGCFLKSTVPAFSSFSELGAPSHHLKCEMKSPHLVDYSWDFVGFQSNLSQNLANFGRL